MRNTAAIGMKKLMSEPPDACISNAEASLPVVSPNSSLPADAGLGPACRLVIHTASNAARA